MLHGTWGVHKFCARLSTVNLVTQDHYPTAGHPASSAGWEPAFSGGVSTHSCADTNWVSFVYVTWFLGHVQGHRASLPASLPMFSQFKLKVSSGFSLTCYICMLLLAGPEWLRHWAGQNPAASSSSSACGEIPPFNRREEFFSTWIPAFAATLASPLSALGVDVFNEQHTIGDVLF